MRLNLRSLGSGLVGALSLTTPGKKLLDVYFWDGVLHLVTSDPLLTVAKEYGPALAFLALALYLATSPADRTAFYERVRHKVNWYLASTVILGVATVIAFILYLWDRSRGPIIWLVNLPASPTRESSPHA
jgi:hypothetical protein